MTTPFRHTCADRMEVLTVADAMTRYPKVIHSSVSMHEAACILADSEASCAPVIDDSGACVGVLSASDFLTFEIDRTGRVVEAHGRDVNLPEQGEQLPWNCVRKFMSTAVQTISAAAPLVQAGEIMCAEHLHRLFVLDARGVPVGVISTTDVVAALVKSIREHKTSVAPASPSANFSEVG